MKKRILSLVLAALLTLLILPVSTSAQNEVNGLIVNDVDVATAVDPADVLGDGTVSFDTAAGVLTLTNANLTVGLSDPAQDWAEHPAIYFGGRLTIRLRGCNTISTGTSTVMGQALRNSAICGDELTVTADPGATLEVKGMVQVKSYAQTGGAVSVEMENYHSQIMKWAVYVEGGPLSVTGGTLAAASTGGKRGGAIGLSDGAAVSSMEGAVFTEGDLGFDNQVPALSFSGGLMPTSKNYAKIEAAGSAQPRNIAYASTQTVSVDGRNIEFQCYALKDAGGNPTNYIKLRDLAILLNGTAAQFDVGWDGNVNILTRKAYTPNGSELKTPFSGDRAYQETGAVTKVDGRDASLAAFMLLDDAGGGYTYYKLRDLGRAVGFNVGWSADRGIFVETDKPYTDAD